MKATKSIQGKYEKFMKIKFQEQQLISEIFKWLETNGVDTTTDAFMDSIGARIIYNEFDSFEHFYGDLIEYIDGETVGYG
ncbi:hypothetical protein [Paenibacillus xylanexedens]|uniref:hypothetical protein n=1 Tax=Paenibacillus xylanexedens TaxID=528191 RepID=UPI0011A4711F|nr:hypothetical protein [Paenibacillus xylanexedens]